MSRIAPILLLAVACGETQLVHMPAEDGGLPCPSESPWRTCSDELEFPHSGSWTSDVDLVAGAGTVTDVVPGEAGPTVSIRIDGRSHTIELPAPVGLTVDDEVTVTEEDNGFTVAREGTFVAFVGSSVEEAWEPFRSAARGEAASLTLGDRTYELRPLCAGPFDRNDSCSVDVGAVVFGLAYEGTLIEPGETRTVTTPTGERVVAVRRILERDDRFASQCETCSDLWFPLVDVTIAAVVE